jgi:Glyoxalase-like domain
MAAVIDHLIYAVRDVEAAGARLAAMGLTSYFGGTHPAMGTSNRIVPLGPSYIELVGPAPSSFGADRFVGWMLRGVPMPDDAMPMQRVRDDGTTLSWRLAGLWAASFWELDPLAPIYIEWDEGVPLPGSVDPIGALAAVEFSATGVVAARVRLNDGRVVNLV